jgi:hypothetical protein
MHVAQGIAGKGTRLRGALRRVEAPWSSSIPAARVSASEVAAAGLLLAVVAAAVFGSHVAQGGFYSDDWANVERYQHSPEPRFSNAVELNMDILGARPLLAVELVLPYVVLGSDPAPHLALALLLSVLVCVCFYLLLRTLGMERLHAGMIAALALLFPWSDSTKLWATAGLNNTAVCFYLLGAVVALHGLAAQGRRALLLHAGAVALYVLSVLTYEVAAIAILLSGLLYAVRAPWSSVMRRWAVDVVVVGATLLWAARETREARGVAGVRARLSDVPLFAEDAWSILRSSFEPFGLPVWVLIGAAAVAAVALLARGHPRSHTSTETRHWLLVAAASAVAVCAAYVVVLGSTLYPLKLGLENRGNVFAALPFAALIYSVLMAGAAVLAGSLRARRVVTATVAVAGVLLVAAGYVDRVLDDKRLWRTAAERQDDVLAAVERALGVPAGGSTIYTFGHVGQVSPGVPVFSESWDLSTAVQVEWEDDSLTGYPILQGTTIACGAREMVPFRAHGGYVNSSLGREQGARYGTAFVVDVAAGRADRIDDRSDCLTTIPAYPLEPFYPGAAQKPPTSSR